MKKPGINYLYFGVFFLILLLTSASGISAKENLSGSRFFFFLYAAGQALIESYALALGAWTIRRYLNGWIFHFYIGATFLLLVFHVLDFLMDRILDLSIWETISFVLDETFANFLYLLDASGVPLWAWGLIFASLAALPLLGILLYRFSETLIEKRPLQAKAEHFFVSFFCLPVGLLLWDYSASRTIHPDSYTAFLQSLPWKLTFLEPKSVVVPLEGPLREAPSEQVVSAEIASNEAALKKKPNIYLFVIESFRSDAIDADRAPHLHALREASPISDVTLSNANASQMSWFSIFHSQFAHHWNRLQKMDWQMGSPPLSLLKKWGYQIRLYSAAQLRYYGMEELLFGKDNRLLDSDKRFPHAPPVEASTADAAALHQLQQDMEDDPSLRQGQVFIIFWDSTHFDYSWPKESPAKFAPFANDFAYFHIFQSKKQIELIKNRYRNAVYYIDSLIGKFLEKLPNKKEAVILITGDHGEEFFERGHLFHGSHLIKEQTRVPIIMKFGARTLAEKRSLVSQVDIFPSLLDHLSGEVPSFLQGQSVFQKKQWPYTVIARFNAGRTPYEVCLHSAAHKLIARFPNRSDIFRSNALQIRSLRSAEDRVLFNTKKDLNSWIRTEFGPVIERLSDKAKSSSEAP